MKTPHSDAGPGADPAAFVGWVRNRGRPWKPAASAATWRECWALLLAVPGGLVTDRVVLPRGQKP